MKTLCIQTMEELLSSRCHKSSTSLSFLFLISQPFLYNPIKNWKIKIIFTVSMWTVRQKAHGLGCQRTSELEKRLVFYVFLPFLFIPSFLLFIIPALPVLPSFAKDHRMSRVEAETHPSSEELKDHRKALGSQTPRKEEGGRRGRWQDI